MAGMVQPLSCFITRDYAICLFSHREFAMNTRHFAILILGLTVSLRNCRRGAADERLMQLTAEHRQQYARASFFPDGCFVAAVGVGGKSGRLTGGHLTNWELGICEIVTENVSRPFLMNEPRFGIEITDFGGWLRVTSRPGGPAGEVARYLSQSLNGWMQDNPQLRVRLIVPINSNGDTSERHAWNDLIQFPHVPVVRDHGP